MKENTDHLYSFRSVCKDPAAAGGETSEEKENYSEEEHFKPLL